MASIKVEEIRFKPANHIIFESRHSIVSSVDDHDEVITEENGETGSEVWNCKKLEKSLQRVKEELDRNERFLNMQEMNFGNSQRIQIEIGGVNNTETEMSMDNLSSSSGTKKSK